MKSQGTLREVWSGRPYARATRTLALTILLAAGLPGAFGIARADVPAGGDIAACNQAARDEVRGRASSPTSKDEAGAVAARTGAAAAESRGAALTVTQSADPQIDGMDGEGAKDGAYRAAYRVCMRRKGF